ncbi:MAG: hypothetical protein R2881_07420 [Eubacteriales bacterium]
MKSPAEGTDFVATMHPTAEYKYGLTRCPRSRACLRDFAWIGVESKDLSIVSVKNHDNACHNPVAHIQRPVVLERITNPAYINATNPIVADPPAAV